MSNLGFTSRIANVLCLQYDDVRNPQAKSNILNESKMPLVLERSLSNEQEVMPKTDPGNEIRINKALDKNRINKECSTHQIKEESKSNDGRLGERSEPKIDSWSRFRGFDGDSLGERVEPHFNPDLRNSAKRKLKKLFQAYAVHLSRSPSQAESYQAQARSPQEKRIQNAHVIVHSQAHLRLRDAQAPQTGFFAKMRGCWSSVKAFLCCTVLGRRS